MSSRSRIVVSGIPGWVDASRLLGSGFAPTPEGWAAELPIAAAADVSARLRGVALGGRPIDVATDPPLPRAAVRAGRLADARARRDTTPGFTRAGTRLDEEGRWSLTPEALALALGRRAAGRAVADATCGCGGNAIGFARAGCSVTAIDLDPRRIALARHNARVYGVADRVAFLTGRAEAILPSLAFDLLFIDPPWGRDWPRSRCGRADLPALTPILTVARGETWVKLPPSFDPGELPAFTPEAWFGAAPGDDHRVKFLLLRRG